MGRIAAMQDHAGDARSFCPTYFCAWRFLLSSRVRRVVSAWWIAELTFA
jgi:hypothetical protein